MTRNFGWSLPPGTTQKMIDDAFGGDLCECSELERRERDRLVADGFPLSDAEVMVEDDAARGRLLCARCAFEARRELDRDEADAHQIDERSGK